MFNLSDSVVTQSRIHVLFAHEDYEFAADSAGLFEFWSSLLFEASGNNHSKPSHSDSESNFCHSCKTEFSLVNRKVFSCFVPPFISIEKMPQMRFYSNNTTAYDLKGSFFVVHVHNEVWLFFPLPSVKQKDYAIHVLPQQARFQQRLTFVLQRFKCDSTLLFPTLCRFTCQVAFIFLNGLNCCRILRQWMKCCVWLLSLW